MINVERASESVSSSTSTISLFHQQSQFLPQSEYAYTLTRSSGNDLKIDGVEETAEEEGGGRGGAGEGAGDPTDGAFDQGLANTFDEMKRCVI